MPRLLDLFCGAGGASMGYYRAGFEVWGVDKTWHRDYPFRQIVGDALEVFQDSWFVDSFDVIAASPPCQPFTALRSLRDARGHLCSGADLVAETRQALVDWGGIYVIENVVGAPLIDPVMLCGSSFGLRVRRHRLFESNAEFFLPRCRHELQGTPVGVYGALGDEIPNGGNVAVTLEDGQDAMGIDWMRWADLVEAIPPAYTEELGHQLLHGPPPKPTEDVCAYCYDPLPPGKANMKFCSGRCRTAAHRARQKVSG